MFGERGWAVWILGKGDNKQFFIVFLAQSIGYGTDFISSIGILKRWMLSPNHTWSTSGIWNNQCSISFQDTKLSLFSSCLSSERSSVSSLLTTSPSITLILEHHGVQPLAFSSVLLTLAHSVISSVLTVLNTIYTDVSHMSLSRPDLPSEGQDAESNCLLDTLIWLPNRHFTLTSHTAFLFFIPPVFPISLNNFILSATQEIAFAFFILTSKVPENL